MFVIEEYLKWKLLYQKDFPENTLLAVNEVDATLTLKKKNKKNIARRA